MKVIFHIDEMSKWDLILKNVKNFLNEKTDATIEVLANSEAVKGYLDEENIKKIEELNANFVSCGNALKGNDIKKEDLTEKIKVVPAGVVELAKKQSEGYAYIRP